jgi:hypothetical protein
MLPNYHESDRRAPRAPLVRAGLPGRIPVNPEINPPIHPAVPPTSLHTNSQPGGINPSWKQGKNSPFFAPAAFQYCC